jgi:excisionase family DNA binding protein
MAAKKKNAPPAAPAPDALLTIDELATQLRVKRRAVERLIARRAIPVIRINARVLRFRWREVETALAKLTVRAI